MLSFSVVLLLAAGIAHASFYVPSQDELVLVTSSLMAGAAGSAHSSRSLLSPEGDTSAARGPSSVVQDWSLVCKQLCGAGLGGKPCAPYCTAVDVSLDLQQSNAASMLSPGRESICENLCSLQLGESSCHCANAADTNELTTSTMFDLVDRNLVCESFCSNTAATIAGCSLCSLKRKAMAADDVDTNTAESTTPNWNALCVSLCKTGDGGSLCNCDLSPFF